MFAFHFLEYLQLIIFVKSLMLNLLSFSSFMNLLKLFLLLRSFLSSFFSVRVLLWPSAVMLMDKMLCVADLLNFREISCQTLCNSQLKKRRQNSPTARYYLWSSCHVQCNSVVFTATLPIIVSLVIAWNLSRTWFAFKWSCTWCKHILELIA